MPTTTFESPQDFAARYWGGAEAQAVKSPADRGPRNVDGGRVRYPAHWKFQAEGMTYRVYPAPKPKRPWDLQWPEGTWHMEVGYDGCASFRRDGAYWVVESYGDTRTVPALDVVEADPAPIGPVLDISHDADDYEDGPQMCECELDWNCPLHQGQYTAIERINDAWASEQTEADRQGGWF